MAVHNAGLQCAARPFNGRRTKGRVMFSIMIRVDGKWTVATTASTMNAAQGLAAGRLRNHNHERCDQ